LHKAESEGRIQNPESANDCQEREGEFEIQNLASLLTKDRRIQNPESEAAVEVKRRRGGERRIQNPEFWDALAGVVREKEENQNPESEAAV